MSRQTFGMIAAAIVLAVPLPTAIARAANCRPPCANVPAAVRAVSVIPGDNDAAIRGELFTGGITTLSLAGNRSEQVKLNFGFKIGSTTYSTVSVSENGFVTFVNAGRSSAIGVSNRAAVGNGFQPVGSLTELGGPVIAPFYADLLSSRTPNQDYLGNVVVQYGTADPYANGGQYQRRDFQNAVRITWYGLATGGGNIANNTVFAQLVLAGNDHGTSSFNFNYGPPGRPGQAGLGSIAGFSLGDDHYDFHGPYGQGSPTYFEFDNGYLAGPLGAGGVPEPATWVLQILGAGLIGGALRRRASGRRVFGGSTGAELAS